MHAQHKRGFTVIIITTILGIYGIILHLKDGCFGQEPVAFVTDRQYSNITGLSEDHNCRVRIIYNLNSSGLLKIQNERKSRVREVCDMCRRNKTSMECDHVAEKIDYLHVRPEMYSHLLVNDKHKVKRLECDTVSISSNHHQLLPATWL